MNNIEEIKFLINTYEKCKNKKIFNQRLKELYLQNEISKKSFICMKSLVEDDEQPSTNTTIPESDGCSKSTLYRSSGSC